VDVRHDTVQDERIIEGLEMDIVSHDVKKFFGLMLKKNGYVLEQLHSPVIVHTTPEHDELKAIARGCVYRVLLTGIWLMRTGEIEANLLTLNEDFQLPFIGELVQRKLSGPEQSTLNDADIDFHTGEYERLRAELQAAHEACHLPELPTDSTRSALNDLLIRLRLNARG
jgi:uncharacterized protein